MLTLLAIVFVAVLAVALSRAERPRRWALVLMGLLCLALAARAAVLLTQLSLANLPANVAVADEPASEAVEAEVATTDEILELEEEAPAAEVTEEAKPLGPVERVASVQYLDLERYPQWLTVWKQSGEPVGSSFSLASSVADERDVRYAVVESSLCLTDSECRRDLDQRLKEETDEYINEYLDSHRAALLLGYRADEIRAQLVRDTFVERIFLPEYDKEYRRASALVGFGDAFRRGLDERWSQVVAASRLMQLGLGAGVVILLLASMCGYFRLDTATRGYYTGRLQFATAAAILAVVAAGFLVARWIPWM